MKFHINWYISSTDINDFPLVEKITSQVITLLSWRTASSCVNDPGNLITSFFFKFYFIFKLYNIVLVLPNIEMNPPQVYLCSHPEPSSLLPPHTLPLGRPSAPAPSIQYRASNLDWWLISYMILYMFQCHSPKYPHPLPLPQSP